MFGTYTPLTYFFLALGLAAFVVEAWAFIDCLTRPGPAFAANGKLTKPMWLIIRRGPDLDPAGRGVRRGRDLPGRRPSQGAQLPQEQERHQLGPLRPLVSQTW